MKPFENIDLKHTNHLIAKYRVLNHNWERVQIGNELYPDENKEFLINIVDEVRLMENEIIKYLQVFDTEKLTIVLNSLISDVKRNIEIYEKREKEINEAHKNIPLRYNWYNQVYLESKRILRILENYTEKTEKEIKELPILSQKLKWNGQTNVLYDLFRQLKNIVGKDKNNPLIPNSIPEVALFLKQSFTNLENVSLSTIETQLKNNKYYPNERPSANKRIELDCK